MQSPWQRLAPRKYRTPDQINQPLGIKRANRMGRLMGVAEDMILTDEEYQCLIGSPPRTDDQKIVFECVGNLTNPIGNAEIPLSSYGLSITHDGLVQSNCAPGAPCIEFNDLLGGPLEKIALECGLFEKFLGMVIETPFLEFADEGNTCQSNSDTACTVGTRCRRDNDGNAGYCVGSSVGIDRAH